MVGIVELDGWPIQQTQSPWWCHLLLQWHGCGKSTSPTPRSFFRRGRAREIFKGLFDNAYRSFKKIISKVDDFILVFISSQLLLAPKQCSPTSPTVRTAHTSYLFPLMPFLHVFGWLYILFLVFFVWSIRWSKRWDGTPMRSPPHSPPL
jgi:hypothetical protein